MARRLPYGKPLQRYREYIAILRSILAREQPLQFDGKEYQIPYRGPGATGLGKPLKSILHGRSDMKVYTASISPKASSWRPNSPTGILPVWMSPTGTSSSTSRLSSGVREGRRRQEPQELRPRAVRHMA